VFNGDMNAGIGQLIAGIALLNVRDNKVTSEQAGAAPAAVVSDLIAKAQTVAKEQAAQSAVGNLLRQ